MFMTGKRKQLCHWFVRHILFSFLVVVIIIHILEHAWVGGTIDYLSKVTQCYIKHDIICKYHSIGGECNMSYAYS